MFSTYDVISTWCMNSLLYIAIIKRTICYMSFLRSRPQWVSTTTHYAIDELKWEQVNNDVSRRRKISGLYERDKYWLLFWMSSVVLSKRFLVIILFEYTYIVYRWKGEVANDLKELYVSKSLELSWDRKNGVLRYRRPRSNACWANNWVSSIVWMERFFPTQLSPTWIKSNNETALNKLLTKRQLYDLMT